jgi:hypothetical protein
MASTTFPAARSLVLAAIGLLACLLAPSVQAQPANDAFASAVAVTGITGTVTGTNVAATRQTGEPTHGIGTGNSVWWRWTPSASGPVAFSSAASSGSTVLRVYTGTAVSALTEVAPASGTTQTNTALTFFAVASTNYYVAIDAVLGLTGATSLTWSQTLPPASGWWWNPNEPGRGFALEVTPISPLLTTPRIFFGSFGYEDAGRAVWHVSSGIMNSVSSYSGSLDQYYGGSHLTAATTNAARLGAVGTVTLNFTSATAGTLTWPGGTTPIRRYEFTANGLTATPISAAPQTGWWWSAAEPGQGVFIETQGSAMQMASFMYDSAGRATWYISQNSVTAATTYAGRLLEYAGGQSMTGAFTLPGTASDRGALTVLFPTPLTATMTLPGGRVVALTRFNF